MRTVSNGLEFTKVSGEMPPKHLTRHDQKKKILVPGS